MPLLPIPLLPAQASAAASLAEDPDKTPVPRRTMRRPEHRRALGSGSGSALVPSDSPVSTPLPKLNLASPVREGETDVDRVPHRRLHSSTTSVEGEHTDYGSVS